MAQKPSEVAAVVAVIDPDANAAGALTSAYVDMSKFEQLMAIVMAGDLGASATLDAKLVEATSAAGANVKDISGKAITQLTQAGTDSNKQATINLRADELDVAGGFRYVALVFTTGVAASDGGAVVLGPGRTHSQALSTLSR